MSSTSNSNATTPRCACQVFGGLRESFPPLEEAIAIELNHTNKVDEELEPGTATEEDDDVAEDETSCWSIEASAQLAPADINVSDMHNQCSFCAQCADSGQLDAGKAELSAQLRTPVRSSTGSRPPLSPGLSPIG